VGRMGLAFVFVLHPSHLNNTVVSAGGCGRWATVPPPCSSSALVLRLALPWWLTAWEVGSVSRRTAVALLSSLARCGSACDRADGCMGSGTG
jgi:hypothetical protein